MSLRSAALQNAVETPSDAVAHGVFIALAAAALILMAVLSQHYPISGDEPEEDIYGNLAYRYYRSGFSDLSVIDYYKGRVGFMNQHGVLFDLACAAIEKVSPLARYGTRHLLNGMVGWLGMVYAALIAGLFGGRRASCVALLFLLLSPRYFGDSMNNPKDIPFATTYVACVYYLLRADARFPFFSPSLLFKLILAAGAAIEVRAGGLLLVGYYWLLLIGRAALERIDDWKRWAVIVAQGLIVSVLAILAGSILWPWASRRPLVRPFQALVLLSHFKYGANFHVLFRGEMYRADSLPLSYLPTWFAITTPLAILFCAIFSITLFAWFDGEARVRLGMLWFSLLFPILYAIATRAVVYNGMRHLLFVYPLLVVLAANGLAALIEWARPSSLRLAGVLALVAFAFWDPLRFMIVNRPLQIVYFNPLVGGIRGAFGRYDIDYWANSFGPAIEWIDKASGVPPDRAIRLTGVKHPSADLLPYYAQESSRMIYAGVYRARRADFYLDQVFGSPAEQQRALTTGRILHTIEADGVPLCLIKAGPGWTPR